MAGCWLVAALSFCGVGAQGPHTLSEGANPTFSSCSQSSGERKRRHRAGCNGPQGGLRAHDAALLRHGRDPPRDTTTHKHAHPHRWAKIGRISLVPGAAGRGRKGEQMRRPAFAGARGRVAGRGAGARQHAPEGRGPKAHARSRTPRHRSRAPGRGHRAAVTPPTGGGLRFDESAKFWPLGRPKVLRGVKGWKECGDQRPRMACPRAAGAGARLFPFQAFGRH